MYRFISIFLVVALAVCLAAPASAAVTTEEDLFKGLGSGWYWSPSTGTTTTPYGMNGTWFYYVFDMLALIVKAVTSDSGSGSGSSSSWSVTQVTNLLNYVSQINTKLGDLSDIITYTRYLQTYLPGMSSSLSSINSDTSSIKSFTLDLNSNLLKVVSNTGTLLPDRILQLNTDLVDFNSDVLSYFTWSVPFINDIDLQVGRTATASESIQRNFVTEKYIVDDYDTRNIFLEGPSFYGPDTSSSLILSIGSSTFSQSSEILVGSPSLLPKKLYEWSLPDNRTSITYSSGSYRLDNCYIWVRPASGGNITRYDCNFGDSVIYDIPYDFNITRVGVYWVDPPSIQPMQRLPIACFGPLDVVGTNGLLQAIANKLALLQYSLADTDAINAKLKNQGVIDSATDDFFSGSDSSTSLGTGGLGNIKSVGDTVGSVFDSGVSAGDLGSALDGAFTNDGGLGWFSSQTADDLDSVSTGFSVLSIDDDPIVTDYVSEYQASVFSWLNERGDDGSG